MLTELIIKNYTIIDKLHIEFPSQMIALTGETGAGKSIIIDTLELVFGARINNNVVRNSTQRCEITAIFSIKNIPQATDWLIKS